MNKANIIITLKCNLNCMHCYLDAGESIEKFDLVFDKYIELIDKLVNDGFTEIMLTGGECMVHSKLIEMINYAKSKDLIVGIFTNGMIYSETVFDLVDKVNISLDGPSEIHNYIRKNINSYDNVIRVLDYLKKIDKYTTIQVTLNQYNYEKIEFISAVALSHLNVRKVRLVFTDDIGRASENKLITNAEIKNYIFKKIDDLYLQTEFHIQFSTNLISKYDFVQYYQKTMPFFPVWFDLINDKAYIIEKLYELSKIDEFNKNIINNWNQDIHNKLVNFNLNSFSSEFIDVVDSLNGGQNNG